MESSTPRVWLHKLFGDVVPDQVEYGGLILLSVDLNDNSLPNAGDLIFSIFNGKVPYLWRLQGYVEDKNSSKGNPIVEQVREYSPPIDLRLEFIPFEGFQLDIVLLQKAAKRASKIEFHEMKLEDGYEESDAPKWNFAGRQRRIVMITSSYLKRNMKNEEWRVGDLLLRFDDELRGGLVEVFSENVRFEFYQPLKGLGPHDLNALLSQAHGRPQKTKFLTHVIGELKRVGVYEIKKNPVALYDHVLSAWSGVEDSRDVFWGINLDGLSWLSFPREENKLLCEFGRGELDQNSFQLFRKRLGEVQLGSRLLMYRIEDPVIIEIVSDGTVVDVIPEDQMIEYESVDSKIGARYGPIGSGWRMNEVIHEVPKAAVGVIFGSDEALELKNRNLGITGNLGAISLEMEPALGVEALAEEVAKVLVRMENEPGMMVGVFGRWGRGKTYLVDRIRKHIDKGKLPFRYVKFNAWHYQETPASWAYLYEVMADAYLKPTGKWTLGFVGRLVKLNVWREPWPLLWFLVSLTGACFWYFGFTPFERINILWSIVTFAPFLPLMRIYLRYRTKATNLFDKYVKRKSFEHLLGFQSEIQNELRMLLKLWIPGKSKERVLLFVDDIDRCSEERIMQIVDALRLMVDDPEVAKRVVVIAAIDEHILGNAIRHKYKHLLQEEVSEDELRLRVREYLDKLFIVGIKLNPLGATERNAILESIVKGRVSELGPEFDPEVPEEQNEAEGKVPNPDTKVDAVEGPDEIEVEDPDEGGDDGVGTLIPPTTYIVAPEMKPGQEIRSTERRGLERGMRHLSQGSPRQLRIYYYRYLLTRNLLIQRLRLEGNETIRNEWDHQLAHEDFLAIFIACYSEHPVSVSKLVRAFLDGKPESNEIVLYGKAYRCDPRLLEEILGVVEVVVAY